MRRIGVVVACLLLIAGCGGSSRRQVAVSAAASTREPLLRLARDFQEQTGISVTLNLGPSSTLAKQIEEGGPAEVFLPADEGWADYLGRAGLVEARRDLLGNRLVVVVPPEKPLSLTSMGDLSSSSIKHLALAGAAVPAGKYARDALAKAGIWNRVKDRVISGNDVRAALAFVERGEADAAILYETDAAVSSRVKIALKVPAHLHQAIRYPLVLVRTKSARPEARRLFDFFASDRATTVFRQAGFDVLTGE
jgi:molybdate transport system substrate-binding protein